MKRLPFLLLILPLVCSTHLLGQSVTQSLFDRFDQKTGETGVHIIKGSDNRSYLWGSTTGDGGADVDPVLLKLGADLKYQDNRTYSGNMAPYSADELGQWIAETNDGDLVTASNRYDGTNRSGGHLRRLNKDFTVDWEFSYHTDHQDYINHHQVHSGGKVIVIGTKGRTNNQLDDLYITRVNAGSGNVEKGFNCTIPNHEFEGVASVELSNGNIGVLANITDFSSGAPVKKYFYMVVNINFVIQGSPVIYSDSEIKDINAVAILAGDNSSAIIVGDLEGEETIERDFFAHKISSSTSLTWQNVYRSPLDQIAYGGLKYENGTFLILGETGTTNCGTNGLLMHLATNGEMDWAKSYGGDQNERLYNGWQSGNQLIVAGQSTYTTDYNNSNLQRAKDDSRIYLICANADGASGCKEANFEAKRKSTSFSKINKSVSDVNNLNKTAFSSTLFAKAYNENLNCCPIANFSFTTTNGGNTYSFLNTSEQFNEWGAFYLWDFGDGNTSTMENPTHTYTSPGNYNVTFTIATGCDKVCSDNISKQIQVGAQEICNNGIDDDHDGLVDYSDPECTGSCLQFSETFNFNVFVRDQYRAAGGHVEGPVAIGDDLIVEGAYSFANNHAGVFVHAGDDRPTVLLINDQLQLNSGGQTNVLQQGFVKLGDDTGQNVFDEDPQNGGDVNTQITPGSYNSNPKLQLTIHQDKASVLQSNIFDFAAIFNELETRAIQLSNNASNVTVSGGSNAMLSITPNQVNILNISGTTLNSWNEIIFSNTPNINTPVLINVDAAGDFAWDIPNFPGIGDQQGAFIVFNFYNSENVKLSNGTIKGTVFAASGNVHQVTSGNIDGQVIARTFSQSSGEIHYYPFVTSQPLFCQSGPEICDNGIDDDNDGKIDCADTECLGLTGNTKKVSVASGNGISITILN